LTDTQLAARKDTQPNTNPPPSRHCPTVQTPHGPAAAHGGREGGREGGTTSDVQGDAELKGVTEVRKQRPLAGAWGVRAQHLVPQREVWNYGAMNHEVTDENEAKKKEENITLENMIGSKIGLGKKIEAREKEGCRINSLSVTGKGEYPNRRNHTADPVSTGTKGGLRKGVERAFRGGKVLTIERTAGCKHCTRRHPTASPKRALNTNK